MIHLQHDLRSTRAERLDRRIDCTPVGRAARREHLRYLRIQACIIKSRRLHQVQIRGVVHGVHALRTKEVRRNLVQGSSSRTEIDSHIRIDRDRRTNRTAQRIILDRYRMLARGARRRVDALVRNRPRASGATNHAVNAEREGVAVWNQGKLCLEYLLRSGIYRRGRGIKSQRSC